MTRSAPTRVLSPLVLAALSAWLCAGCAAGSASFSGSSKWAPSSQVFTPPEGACPVLEAPEIPALAEPDAAPLSVSVDEKGDLSLDSRGARAGRVLMAIAAGAGTPIHVEGRGALTPIFASKRAPLRTLVENIAAVTGMQVVEGEPLSVLDPEIATLRARRAKASVSLVASETRLYPSAKPWATGKFIAELLLGCRGVVVTLPAKGALYITDTSPNHDRIARFINAIEAEVHTPLDMAMPRSRHVTYGVPAPNHSACDPSTANHSGPLIGALLIDTAKRHTSPLVSGCGADRAHFSAPEPAATLAQVCARLGMAHLEGGLCVPLAFAQHNQANRDPLTLRIFEVEDARGLAEILRAGRLTHEAILHDDMGRLIIVADEQGLDATQNLISSLAKVDYTKEGR